MRRLVQLAASASVALTLAACSAKETPSEPAGNEQVTHGSLADCLKANGLPETSGPAAVLGPPTGVDQATWDGAMKACSTLSPGPGGH